MVSWSMDDVAAAGAELDAREEAKRDPDRVISLGSDADLLLGPALTRERARHRPAPTSGSKAARAQVRADERARARKELFRQNAGEGLPRAWWPGRPGSWWGWGCVALWLVASAVMWAGVGLVNLAEWGISASRGREPKRAGHGRVWVSAWLVAGAVLVALVGGGGAPGVVGAVVAGVAAGGAYKPRKRGR